MVQISTFIGLIFSALTSFPSFVPISSDTLAATLIAATRRGCVQPIFILFFVKP